MSQIQEMIKPAAAMLDTYPVVTTKQKIKRWIKTCVPGMTPEKAERYSWPQALLAMGLLQAYLKIFALLHYCKLDIIILRRCFNDLSQGYMFSRILARLPSLSRPS